VEGIRKILNNNLNWAESVTKSDPDFFTSLAQQQKPRYLWIGCSDSRVPANQIMGLAPGEVFVHRNIANVVVHTDFNCLSVIDYAVEILQVQHIIVCGHYGCGGVEASKQKQEPGLVHNWLRHIKDVARLREKDLAGLQGQEHSNKLCELNVIEQVRNVCNTLIVQNAWNKGHKLGVHGWVYALNNGILNDLSVTCFSQEEFEQKMGV